MIKRSDNFKQIQKTNITKTQKIILKSFKQIQKKFKKIQKNSTN